MNLNYSIFIDKALSLSLLYLYFSHTTSDAWNSITFDRRPNFVFKHWLGLNSYFGFLGQWSGFETWPLIMFLPFTSSAMILWAYAVLLLHPVLISSFKAFALLLQTLEMIYKAHIKLQYGFTTVIFLSQHIEIDGRSNARHQWSSCH